VSLVTDGAERGAFCAAAGAEEGEEVRRPSRPATLLFSTGISLCDVCSGYGILRAQRTWVGWPAEARPPPPQLHAGARPGGTFHDVKASLEWACTTEIASRFHPFLLGDGDIAGLKRVGG
jgi:hypothetical protein